MCNFQALYKSLKSASAILLLSISHSTFAEDTEIFRTLPPAPTNLLVILDNSGSMAAVSSGSSRMDKVKLAFRDFITSDDLVNTSIGLMTLNRARSAAVIT